MASVVLVFAKAPVAGEVKTRLQPAVSAAHAAELHERMIRHTLEQVTGAGCAVELWMGSHHAYRHALSAEFNIPSFLQCGTQLGERMWYASRQALARADSVIIVGTDCPAIDADYLREASRALLTHDVVLGPADDGGYVLIGLNRADRRVFENVAWGQPSVLEQTRRNLKLAQLSWLELASLADVDRPEDLAAARKRWPTLLG